jgi:electron transport complex protein RnfG
MPFEGEFKVKPDGGQVDALSGATITSRAVANAVTDAVGIYDRVKSQLAEQLKSFPK